MSQPENCITLRLIEMHNQLVINFSQYDYIRDRDDQTSTYGLAIKVVLCLSSIIASLLGNLMVLYNILIKPRSNTNFDYVVNDNCQSETMKLRQIELRRRSSYFGEYKIEEEKRLLAKQQQQQQLNVYRVMTSSVEFDINKINQTPAAAAAPCPPLRRYTISRACKSYTMKPINLFIVNLCICDLMIVIWCSVFHLINTITVNWKLGAFLCRFNTYVQVVSLTAAISTLCFISMERLKAVVCTMSKKLNRAKSIRTIIFIWVFSFIVAFPIFYHRKQFKREWRNHVEIWCSDAWPRDYKFKEKCVVSMDEPLRRIYYTFISLVLFFIPLTIMFICYCLVIKKLNQNSILKLVRDNSPEKILLNKRRQKVNLLLVVLIASFTFCWSPVQGFILYEAHKQFNGQEMPLWFDWFYFLVYLLAYTNSAINPIIYSGLNRVYEKELRKIINVFVGRRSFKQGLEHVERKHSKLDKADSYG